MDATAIVQMVQTIGFPIVMCGAMGLFVKYMYDKTNNERGEMQAHHQRPLEGRIPPGQHHQEEMDKITAALNNNTIALTKLCERMEVE